MSADASTGKAETQPVSEIEALTDNLTQKGLIALYANPEIQRQVLENFENKGEANSNQSFSLKGKDGRTVSIVFGKRIKDGASTGAIFYERMIRWQRERTEEHDYLEAGLIGYKKGDHGILGGLPDRAKIKFHDPNIFETAHFPRGDSKYSQTDTKPAIEKAKDFIAELEELSF